MTQHEHPFHYYRSPGEIREIQFSHRVRGLDEYEVSEFLDLLADQVHATDLELARLRAERDRLRQEVDHLRAEGRQVQQPVDSTRAATPQAASLLMNAQRVADDLVEEAVRRTRDMLTVARAEKNAILRNAQETAAKILSEARESRAEPHLGGWESSRNDPRSRDTDAGGSTGYERPDAGRHSPPRDTGPTSHLASQRTWQLDGHAAV